MRLTKFVIFFWILLIGFFDVSEEKKIIYLKHCEVVSQPEYIKGKVGDILREHKVIKKYAYILHDKDPDTSPHYHIYLNFGRTGIPLPDIAKWFGLQESCVERVKGRAVDVLKYLVHGNDSQVNKHQYDYSEVVSNFDFQAEIETDKVLGDFEKFSYAQQLRYVNSLPVSEKAAAFSKLEKLWKIHCQCLVLNPEREIEVMFIHGKGGTGKTYYARKFLDKMGYDYCVSSSSNDPFQDYMGQNAIILDDLRDKAFEFQDLLKILDNNTASSVRSRFANKVFNGKMIVITSTVPLEYWYRELRFSDNKDDLYQLYRRIVSYVVVEMDYVKVYSEIDNRGCPSGIPYVYKNEIPSLKKISNKEKTDFGAIFGEMLEDASPDLIDELGRTMNVMNGVKSGRRVRDDSQIKINN